MFNLEEGVVLCTLLFTLLLVNLNAFEAVCRSQTQFIPALGFCPKIMWNSSRVAWSAGVQMCAVECASNKAWCNAFYQIGFNCVMFNWTARLPLDLQYVECPAQIFIKSMPVRQLQLGQCQQSSTLDNYFIPTCNKALDGNTDGSFPSASCTHTANTEAGWWQASVANQSAAFISSVTLYNRVDCCPERLTNFVIMVDGTVCARHFNYTFANKTFACGRIGSVLLVQLLLETSVLSICEAQVIGF